MRLGEIRVRGDGLFIMRNSLAALTLMPQQRTQIYLRGRLARIKLERPQVMALGFVQLGQTFIGDRQAAMGGGIFSVEAERALEQGNGLRMLAGLNFQRAVKAEYIGLVRRNFGQFGEYFFGLAALPRMRQFTSARP